MNSTPQTPAQLQSANPADWPVAPGWQPLADAFFAGARGQALLAFLQARLQAGAAIFPPQPLRALELTPPEDVRVVILGQDPYHGRGQAASHAGKGWEELTDTVIRHVAEGPRPVVFMLWGSHAQGKRAWIPSDRGHLVLTSNHPSPLSALRPPVPFIGNGHFGKARDFRAQHGY